MKKIWVIQYEDGTADVYDTPQPPPAYPYVDAFECEERLAEIQTVLDKLLEETDK